MSSELAGNLSFFLSSLVRSTDWKGRCVYLVCRLISFFTDTHQMQNLSGTLKVNFTPPLFSFLLHNLIWGYLIPMCLGIFILISFTRTFSLEIPLWFSFFPLENCIYQSGCSWWYWQLCCINDLLLNWISRLQQQNLNCFFLDLIEVSRNLLSVQSNETDNDHKPETFGMGEVASLQGSQVKYVPGQCFNSWEQIIGEFIVCKITPNLWQMFKTALQHGIL